MDVSARIWDRLVAAGDQRLFLAGETVLRQGDPPTHVLVLMSGRVKVLLTLPDGNVLLLAVRGAGELLGEVAVLGGDGRSATVIALDPCRTYVVPADRFRSLMRSARLEAEVLRRAMQRIREAETWRAEMAALPAGPRVVRALVRLAVPGSGGQVDVGLDQTEIPTFSRGVARADRRVLASQGHRVWFTEICRWWLLPIGRLMPP